MEAWLAGVLRGTDASLLDEWERMRDPNWKPGEDEDTASSEPVDITRDKREFTALIRTDVFRFLRAVSMQNYAAAISALGLKAAPWTEASLLDAIDPYYDEHERISLDNEARNGRHTYVEPSADGSHWRVSQVLVDPEGLNDWQAIFTIDLAQAREEGKPALVLVSIGPVHVSAAEAAE